MLLLTNGCCSHHHVRFVLLDLPFFFGDEDDDDELMRRGKPIPLFCNNSNNKLVGHHFSCAHTFDRYPMGSGASSNHSGSKESDVCAKAEEPLSRRHPSAETRPQSPRHVDEISKPPSRPIVNGEAKGSNVDLDREDGCSNDGDDEYESPRENAATAEMFAVTAMSLGMENDDLLFNLLYFGNGETTNFGTMFNSAMEETVALHSENNTPYKLRPVSQDIVNGLEVQVLSCVEQLHDLECSVCKDELEIGCEFIELPSCHHPFHRDCVVRWLKMQSWCPVCRAPITRETCDDAAEQRGTRKLELDAVTEGNESEKSN